MVRGGAAGCGRCEPGERVLRRGDGVRQVVAFAQAGHRQEPGDAELWRFYVLPAHQRMGIGRRLLHACLDALRAQGPVSRLFVQVEAENKGGRRAYKRLGFHNVREYDADRMGHVTRMWELCLRLHENSV